MKSKRFTAVFLISILFLVSVIAVLWIKNNKLKKELDEYSTYKRVFVAVNGVVCPIAPVKAEDINKPLYLESCVNGIVSSWLVAENSAGLKDGGKLFLLGKCLLLQGHSGQLQHCSLNNIYMDLHRYPKILNYHQPVQPGEYFVKFGNYGLTTDFKQLSPKENGIRLTFNNTEERQASIEKRQISETLQNFLIAVQIPDYLKHGKADFDVLEHQAESLRLVTLKFNSGADTLDSVLDEELRLLDILMADKSLTGRENELLIKEYWTRLNRLYRIKEEQYKAGALLLKDLKSYKKAVSDFQKAHNIK
jgi:hypothetical protein